MSELDIIQPRLAVLIDADNARPSITEPLLAEVAKYGVASVKRIYGDWTTPNLGGWKTVLLEHSIQPIQQFRYTVGKNATDSAMIIDAMDLLFTNRFDGFCLVSSDSDFTRLAARIREAGLMVYGFGEKKTPKPFVSACDKFIYTEVISVNKEDSPSAIKRKTTDELKGDTQLVNLLRSALEAASDDTGWAQLGTVGSNIAKQSPEFDPRNYGYGKLGELAFAIGIFDVDERVQSDGHSRVIYIRNKPKSRKVARRTTNGNGNGGNGRKTRKKAQ
ncbi:MULTISPECIES: NYN domain-containing protein [Dethiosulfovibrio]|uniref:NYN domain-containing protein n=2 Tax=Dethiosulfovibrio TaxID=47054 RepID=A0ABS9EMR5_9BACT|nr:MULTISPECIES: NYN domain-containing protein [Dethiosulfovibrio]MCF4113385.1 NYN domain-containing protein [Dethiosulfovibrio russensis]MCF4142478.1 NYN domain-containing protein [Dethiosulfovibrio marinus]MCF4145874.1 NYN domain-containing protein [Dethiosulfovibrio acidaminovorans]MEA3283919.1 NYN domain-containing protein [Synergistota bacterium]